MTKIRKVVATAGEMDNEGKIKLLYFSIIFRKDVDKTDEIITVNGRLKSIVRVKVCSLLIIAISMHLA